MQTQLAQTVTAFKIRDWTTINNSLEEIGWLTPNSYGRDFCSPLPCPALYIFSRLDYQAQKGRAMYVGQTKNLRNRWARHQILPHIEATCGPWIWVIKYFIPWDKSRLREDEKFLIAALNPPFNIIGKTRGIS